MSEKKQNCWEFMKCGREPGGKNISPELEICPAASCLLFDGINSGKNGGRICWTVVGTLGHGEISSEYAKEIGSCEKCAFYNKVNSESGESFVSILRTRNRRIWCCR